MVSLRPTQGWHGRGVLYDPNENIEVKHSCEVGIASKHEDKADALLQGSLILQTYLVKKYHDLWRLMIVN